MSGKINVAALKHGKEFFLKIVWWYDFLSQTKNTLQVSLAAKVRLYLFQGQSQVRKDNIAVFLTYMKKS